MSGYCVAGLATVQTNIEKPVHLKSCDSSYDACEFNFPKCYNAQMPQQRHDYLKRLLREHYQANSYVHWTHTIESRETGWLTPTFYYKFRELLTHTLFRYGIACPIYCCMPDHIHLMWIGLFEGTDQLNATRYLRRQVNASLVKVGYRLQLQSYDNVLSENDREREVFEDVCEYIARNPERKNLVEVDKFADYKFTDCLVPGAPELTFSDPGFWESFWRIHSAVSTTGLQKLRDVKA